MNKTASQTVHETVMASKLISRPLDIHEQAMSIATVHGIDGNGIWLIEQALTMVGSRSGIAMKIGCERPAQRPGAATAAQFG